MPRLISKTLVLLSVGVCTECAALADIAHWSGSTAGSYFTASTGSKHGEAGLHLVYGETSFAAQDPGIPLSLGSFTLAPAVGSPNCTIWSERKFCVDDYTPYAFELTLSFDIPVGQSMVTVVSHIPGDLQGRVARNAQANTAFGSLDIVFPKTPTVFGFHTAEATGSFGVTIDDVLKLKPNHTIALTGSITDVHIQPVPEPASVVLVGLIMIGVVAAMTGTRAGQRIKARGK